MCQPLFSLKILGIQNRVIPPFPLLLAPNALQKVWWWVGVSGCLLHTDVQQPEQGWGFRGMEKSSSALCWALGAHSHLSLDKGAVCTQHEKHSRSLWCKALVACSPNKNSVPRTQLLDLKANLVLRVQFTRAWKWMWGHVSEELGAKDNTHLVSLRWQGCPSPVISAGCCSCSTHSPDNGLFMAHWPGAGQSNSHFCSRCIIPLLWHRQHL